MKTVQPNEIRIYVFGGSVSKIAVGADVQRAPLSIQVVDMDLTQCLESELDGHGRKVVAVGCVEPFREKPTGGTIWFDMCKSEVDV